MNCQNSIFTFTELTHMNSQSLLDEPLTKLKASIIEARGDINQIRMLLKGNVELCKKLFKEAVNEDDAITQIQLSYAYAGIKQGNDDTKDFSSLTIGDLETFFYYPAEFELFNTAYDMLMEVKSDWKTSETRSLETFRIAASRGYLPAFLELKHKAWKQHQNWYCFAVQLRPFIGKGDRFLDYYFGQALKNGCPIGSALYYEGLYWMNESSGGTFVKYPKNGDSFEDFKNKYLTSSCDVFLSKYDQDQSKYYEHDGFVHVGTSVVLVPSKEAWDNLVKGIQKYVTFSPKEFYIFKHPLEDLASLLNKYKITVTSTNSTINPELKDRFENVSSLIIYKEGKEIGKISVKKGSVIQTFKNKDIQPIIDFVENIMTKTGSADSARSWLECMLKKEKFLWSLQG